MAKERPRIPQEVIDDLMVANKRSCCICHRHKTLQIHHINEDPTDNRPINLAALCLACHSKVTGNEGLGKSYAASEVSKHKVAWEESVRIKRGAPLTLSDNRKPTILREQKRVVVESEDNWHLSYALARGLFMLVQVRSDEPVNIGIATEQQYERKTRGKGFLGDYHQSILEDEVSTYASARNVFVLWMENEGDERATVALDVSIRSLERD